MEQTMQLSQTIPCQPQLQIPFGERLPLEQFQPYRLCCNKNVVHLFYNEFTFNKKKKDGFGRCD